MAKYRVAMSLKSSMTASYAAAMTRYALKMAKYCVAMTLNESMTRLNETKMA